MDFIRELANTAVKSSDQIVRNMSERMREVLQEDAAESRRHDLQRRVIYVACERFACNSLA